MLMISSKLIGVLLGLYIYGVSATPTAVTPNAPALLLPRVIPAANMCVKFGLLWSRRECSPTVGLDTWFDVCVTWRGAGSQEYPLDSKCPENTYCENIHDGHDRSIKCVDQQPPGTSAARKTSKDPIIGSSGTVQALSGSLNAQFRFPVTIPDDMKASVAAFVRSYDGEFAVTPNNILVGKIAGKEITVCKGDRSTRSRAKKCYPTGRYQLSEGERIVFTWGMQNLQVGSLVYTIWPSD